LENHPIEISLVIALYNEEENIKPLLQQVAAALQQYRYEVILVDDGSKDQTVSEIKRLANEQVRLVVFQRNYGQTAAMAAGIDHASGQYIALMDGDLQNNPTDIPAMLQKLQAEGWDMVAGYRKNRKDGMFLRKIPSKIANAIIRKLTGVYVQDYGCSLKIMKAGIAKNLGLYGQLHRFIPVLAQLEGAKITEMAVKHHPRIHGQSKYGINRTFKVISDLILMLFYQKYLQRPMHIFGTTGFISILSGGAISLYLLIIKIMGQDIWGRPLLLLAILLIIGGIQLVTFGLMAEMIMRTYYESQQKNTYRVKERFHFEE
jgi:glycosyltransferase involved in cell wall biosynthesis